MGQWDCVTKIFVFKTDLFNPPEQINFHSNRFPITTSFISLTVRKYYLPDNIPIPPSDVTNISLFFVKFTLGSHLTCNGGKKCAKLKYPTLLRIINPLQRRTPMTAHLSQAIDLQHSFDTVRIMYVDTKYNPCHGTPRGKTTIAIAETLEHMCISGTNQNAIFLY